MKTITVISALLMLLPAVSQSATTGNNVSEKSQSKAEVSGSVLRRLESDKSFQREREMVLRKKALLEGKPMQGLTPHKEKAATAIPSAKEQKIYEELVQAFERNDELSFQSRFQAMMMDHAKSVYADEVLYLAGMMAFSNKLYGRALKYFNQVLTEYPRSNRSRAALYAKAATYRKMNLQTQSTSVFEQVQKRFPGSPEAHRAALDLKVEKK